MKPPFRERLYVTDPEVIAALLKMIPKNLTLGKQRRAGEALVNRGLRFALGFDGDMTVTEAAKHLKVHRNTIFAYIRAGHFPTRWYMSDRELRLPYQEVLQLPVRRSASLVDNNGAPLKPRKGPFSV